VANRAYSEAAGQLAPRGVAEQVLAGMQRRGVTGDVHVTGVRELQAEFAVGKLRNCSSGGRLHIAVRVLRQGRVGFYTTTDPSDPDGAVERAMMAAEAGEEIALELPARLPAAADAPSPESVALFDRAVAELEPAELVRRTQAAYEAIAAVAGGAEVRANGEGEVEETLLLNTSGAEVLRQGTRMSLWVQLARCADDDVLVLWDGRTSSQLDDPALGDLASRIGELYAAAGSQATLPAGETRVVLAPEAAYVPLVPLFEGVDGMNANRGISPLVGKLGEQVLDQRLTLTDDPWLKRSAAAAYWDDEGTPTARKDLFAAGVFTTFLHDLRSAALGGGASTGNGRRGRGQMPRLSPYSVTLQPGATALADLLAEAEDGLYVVSVIGGGPGALAGAFSHPVGVGYLIKEGRLAGRVKDVAISGNSYELLRHGLGGLEDRAHRAGGMMGASLECPHILLDGVAVSGR